MFFVGEVNGLDERFQTIESVNEVCRCGGGGGGEGFGVGEEMEDGDGDGDVKSGRDEG